MFKIRTLGSYLVSKGVKKQTVKLKIDGGNNLVGG